MINIWFTKPPPELPDHNINENIKENNTLHDPSSEQVKDQVKYTACPSPPLFMPNQRPLTYDINIKLSNRWNARKIIEHPSFFQKVFNRGIIYLQHHVLLHI